MQSFAGLNIPSSSAGPSPWARASSCRASASTRPGHSCSPAHLFLGIPFALTLPRPAHPRPPDVMGTHVNRHLTSAVAMALAGVITLVNVYLIYKQLFGAQLLTGSPALPARTFRVLTPANRRAAKSTDGASTGSLADAAQPRRTSRSGRNPAFVTRVNGPHKIGAPNVRLLRSAGCSLSVTADVHAKGSSADVPDNRPLSRLG